MATNKDLAIPEGLNEEGQRAARAVIDFLEAEDRTYTGGCKVFYSPEEWRARGEEYGRDSVLIVVHDGGDHASAFNLDYCCYDLFDRQCEALQAAGFYAEQCTSWYTAIERVGR